MVIPELHLILRAKGENTFEEGILIEGRKLRRLHCRKICSNEIRQSGNQW